MICVSFKPPSLDKSFDHTLSLFGIEALTKRVTPDAHQGYVFELPTLDPVQGPPSVGLASIQSDLF